MEWEKNISLQENMVVSKHDHVFDKIEFTVTENHLFQNTIDAANLNYAVPDIQNAWKTTHYSNDIEKTLRETLSPENIERQIKDISKSTWGKVWTVVLNIEVDSSLNTLPLFKTREKKIKSIIEELRLEVQESKMMYLEDSEIIFNIN